MIKKATNKWFAHCTSRPDAEINILCFVFAGGSPSFFAPWTPLFPEKVNFLPVLYPGREVRIKEKVPDNSEELIKQFIKDNPKVFEKPYIIWGHCSGSLLGLELAYAKSLEGRPPEAFIVSGCEAPQYALRLIPDVKESFDEVSTDDILKSLRAYNLMPDDMLDNPVFRSYFMPIYRSDLSMFSKYRYDNRKKLDCPALVMNGTEDIMLKRENIEKWKDCFSGNVEMLWYSGKHYFVNDHKEEVMDKICEFCKIER